MQYSVGVIELKSVAKGIQAADDALKSAGISLISAQPICPGKFELIITGELAQVNASMEKVRDTYTSYLIDSVLLGRIDPTVVKALLGAPAAGGKRRDRHHRDFFGGECHLGGGYRRQVCQGRYFGTARCSRCRR